MFCVRVLFSLEDANLWRTNVNAVLVPACGYLRFDNSFLCVFSLFALNISSLTWKHLPNDKHTRDPSSVCCTRECFLTLTKASVPLYALPSQSFWSICVCFFLIIFVSADVCVYKISLYLFCMYHFTQEGLNRDQVCRRVCVVWGHIVTQLDLNQIDGIKRRAGELMD